MSELAAAMPFAERLGIEVEAATAEEVRGSLDWAADLCTAGGREALARPLHVGRRFVVVQTNLSDAAEKPVAQVTQTQAVLP